MRRLTGSTPPLKTSGEFTNERRRRRYMGLDRDGEAPAARPRMPSPITPTCFDVSPFYAKAGCIPAHAWEPCALSAARLPLPVYPRPRRPLNNGLCITFPRKRWSAAWPSVPPRLPISLDPENAAAFLAALLRTNRVRKKSFVS